ncbi:hypothetical protein [Rathayibacter soli]|uniref:hypothetical protein n=1 Tax=Rathayibacter soli TaxID=3144168 RepID=UPI0027E495DB|nr:hypothetical protein [Glaciibacter superstes]
MAERSARRSRRAHRPGVPGADPTPRAGRAEADAVRAAGDKDQAWGDTNTSNDAQLKRDVPPHWG